jgi:hypothetical protein
MQRWNSFVRKHPYIGIGFWVAFTISVASGILALKRNQEMGASYYEQTKTILKDYPETRDVIVKSLADDKLTYGEWYDITNVANRANNIRWSKQIKEQAGVK